MTDGWEGEALRLSVEIQQLRELLTAMRIDPDTMEVNFEARPVSRERIERGRAALRAELVAVAVAKAAGTDTKSGEAHAMAVADAILGALGEDGVEVQ